MEKQTLSAIQMANIAMLCTIQDAVRRDVSDACLTYQLCEADLSVLAHLTLNEVLNIVLCAGQISLFPPRPDLASLLRSHGEPAVVGALLRAKGNVLRPEPNQ